MTTMTVSIPRRRGFAVAFLILAETLRAYWHRVPSVTFEAGDE